MCAINTCEHEQKVQIIRPCIKSRGQELIHQKYKASESTIRHNPKEEKKKLTITKKKKKKTYANITQGCETMINDNKEDLRQERCYLSLIG